MTAEPSILRKKLEPEDLFLIFASDGLWEQLSDQAVVEIVSKNPRSVSLFYCCINHSLSHTCFNNRLVTLTACRLTGSIWQKVVGRICWLVGPAKISHLFKPANCYGNVQKNQLIAIGYWLFITVKNGSKNQYGFGLEVGFSAGKVKSTHFF